MGERREGPEPGTALLNAAFVGTGILVATSVLAALAPDTFELLHAWVSGALFLAGTGGFLWAYALGVSRSRTDQVSIAGLFFLSGDAAPAAVRRPFRVALAVEVVVVIAAALVRPYTAVAFGILAPMFGMGLMATWGGRHGRFAVRPPKGTPPPPHRAADGEDAL